MLTTCPSALKALMHKSNTLNDALNEHGHSVSLFKLYQAIKSR